ALVHMRLLLVPLDLVPEPDSLFYRCNVAEQMRVGYPESFEICDVSRLVEVFVERPPPSVNEVAANLAGKLLPQPVQSVQPKGNRLAIPGERQLERIVDLVVAVILLLLFLCLVLLYRR